MYVYVSAKLIIPEDTCIGGQKTCLETGAAAIGTGGMVCVCVRVCVCVSMSILDLKTRPALGAVDS
jgi:hypothetical protein